MQCRLAFSQTADHRLLVMTEFGQDWAEPLQSSFSTSAIGDENAFIERVVLAGLSQTETTDVLADLLLAVSGRLAFGCWTAVELTEVQVIYLGLNNARKPERPQSPLGFTGEEDLLRVFLQAPVALCMMNGPEHTITFINHAYARMIGRRSQSSLAGKPVREAVSELEGQPFFRLLDNVYRTGKPYVGVEVAAKLLNEQTGTMEDMYFDFVYHPVRDKNDEVCGILCQATDVTERVLEKHVRETREAQLYRQWAELDALYREAPMALCLVEAKELKVLRLNKTKARLLGHPAETALGKDITRLFPQVWMLREMYAQVIAQRTARNFELFMPFPDDPGKNRKWLWSLNPVFDARGDVEAIASFMIEITERPQELPNSD